MNDEQDEQEKVVVDVEDVQEVVRWWRRMSEKDKREMSGPAFNLMRKLEKALGEALEARHPKPQWTWERFPAEAVVRFVKQSDKWVCYLPAELTDANANAIVAVLNGGTQEPVAWRYPNGEFHAPGAHIGAAGCRGRCWPLFAGPQVADDVGKRHQAAIAEHAVAALREAGQITGPLRQRGWLNIDGTYEPNNVHETAVELGHRVAHKHCTPVYVGGR